MSGTSFTIVIPTFRRADALRATLDAFLRIGRETDHEIVVVDNAGDDETEAVVEALNARAVRIRYERHVAGGAAAARNRGAELADADWLLFCDDDIVPATNDHLARHLRVHGQFERALVTGEWRFPPVLVDEMRATSFGRYRLEREQTFADEIEEMPLGDGRSARALIASNDLSLRRDLFWELGGFDEDFPFAGAEDQEFSLRARAAGCRLIHDRGIAVWHNDRRVSFDQFCAREERSAHTTVVLARKVPAARSRKLLIDNAPIAAGDRWSLAARKTVKALLSRRNAMRFLHRLSWALERLGATDGLQHRLYRLLVALHIYRGVRAG